MIRRALRSSALPVLWLSSSAALAASPPVGLTLYAEQWNPTQTNGESLVILTSSPTLVSDTLTSAWGSFRNWYLANIPAQLAGANYLHSVSSSAPDGVTLYSRSGDFHRPPEMTLTTQPQMRIVPNGVSAIAGIFSLPGSTLSFCATTPSFAGKYADPCATFTVDMTVNVGMQIGDTPGHMIQVTNATVSLSNFHYGNENFPAEVAVLVSDILKVLGGPDYQAMLAKTVDSQRVSVLAMLQKPIDALDGQIEAYEQTALRNINQQLGSAGAFDRLMHLAVWARNAPNSQMLTLLVAPPKTGLAINPASETAQFSGTMTFDGSVTQLPASCANYNHSQQITAQVQTGPRPVVAFDLSNKPEWGDAPVQPLAVVFNGGALQGRACSYSLGHLAVGLPNLVNFSDIHAKTTGMPSAQSYLLIQPKRWGNPVVLGSNGSVVSVGGTSAGTGSPLVAQIRGATSNPQVLDLTASTGTLLQQGVGALPRQTQIGKVTPGDPTLNPQARAATVSSVGVASTVGSPVAATPTAAAAPNWNAPGAPPGSSSTLTNSSMSRGSTVQQPAIQQPGMRTAPSSLGR